MKSEQHTASAGAVLTDGMTEPVRDWLISFTEASQSDNAQAVGELFGEVFLSADPATVAAVPRAAFLAALPARQTLFKSAGLGEPRLAEARQILIDEQHSVLKTTWAVPPLPERDRPPVRLASSFLLRQDQNGVVAVAYLNEQNITEVIADPGPAQHV